MCLNQKLASVKDSCSLLGKQGQVGSLLQMRHGEKYGMEVTTGFAMSQARLHDHPFVGC